MKKKIVVVCWMVAWLLVLGFWMLSLRLLVNVYDNITFVLYVLGSGCSLLMMLYLTKLDHHAFCKIGLCYDWVVWKDQDDYPRFKRVCVGCGTIQELVYDFLSHSWSDF